MVHYSYEDLSDALDAIVWGNATDEAYEVASRWGYHELFFGAIYRKENWMEVKTAREILKRALKDDIIDYEVPDVDSEAVEKAVEVVELAEQAWSTNVRGPEVEAILKIAAADANGDAPENSEEGDSDSEPEAESIPEGTPSAFADLDEKLSKSEPWDGYNELTVKEVTEGINWFAENDADSILDILQNVWAYESAHKDRARILTFVKEAYVKFGGELGEAEETPEAEQAPEEGEDEGVDSDGDDSVSDEPSGEEEIEADGSGDSGSESHADDDSEPEASAKSGEGKPRQAKSDGENKSGGSDGGKGSPSAEAKLVGLVEKELSKERLDGIPSPPKDKAPELPWNWSEITDTQLHDFHMQYASLAYYKSYQRARDERIALHCKEAADQLRNELLLNADKYDEKGKEIKVTVLDAQVSSDPNVRRWRKMQGKYERFTIQAKHELESLHKIVEALSRLETMRHDSWERSRK